MLIILSNYYKQKEFLAFHASIIFKITAWKEYIREMNAADIPRHAPLAFEENMLVVEPDDPAGLD